MQAEFMLKSKSIAGLQKFFMPYEASASEFSVEIAEQFEVELIQFTVEMLVEAFKT